MGFLTGIFNAAGIDLTTWALLLIVAFYLFRGRRGAQKAGSVFSRVITWAVIVLVTGAIAAALGWAQLDVDSFTSDVGALISWVLSDGIRMAQDLLSGVLS